MSTPTLRLLRQPDLWELTILQAVQHLPTIVSRPTPVSSLPTSAQPHKKPVTTGITNRVAGGQVV